MTSIEELAHNIAESTSGPRGNDSTPQKQRDEFENILLLCPNCHTLIDKNPDEYPASVLRGWKAGHEKRVQSLFRAPKVDNRGDLRALARTKLDENRAIFEAFGPHSIESQSVPGFEAAREWVRKCVGTIVPNNRFVAELFRRNRNLLSPPERDIAEKFFLHEDAFAYNVLSGDKNASAPLFPTEMNHFLEEE